MFFVFQIELRCGLDFRRANWYALSIIAVEIIQEVILRILSGIQPSGKLHIGNYFGAMRQHLSLQADHDGFYFIAD